MKTTISKTSRHSLLLEEEDLHSLCNFISSKYKSVDMTARCIDGSRLDTKDVTDIISFENPNYRRIRSINIEAWTDLEEKLSLDIWADREYLTAELLIKSQVDEQALFTSREILSRLNEAKPWYDLLARIRISYVIFGLWFVWGMISTMELIGGKPPSPTLARFSVIELINITILFTLVAFAVTYPLDWLQKRLFPKVFFLLGKQKKTMDTIRKWRSFTFGSIAFTIVIGVIINLISAWLIK